ncbi:hypothetical protein CMQ_515 [Grosmannia clavigera kw1407]|uniref:Uncharacterized protein n=1 Tax=Grosmannia clavigera (strain kw1407 / UAMH 11150) TaxID=655863 RepID=F0XDC0_GROCL|nr:uncharacterized protein CMQ_515 [Grosmannia clavigera kw1407]EFX03587.1 hypothetical protein CMQ_515 [Grosmannia clavigera kw1407]
MGVTLSTLIGWAAVLGLFGAYSFREWSKSHPAQLAKVAQQKQRQERHFPTQRKEQKEAKPKRARASEPPQAAKSAAATVTAPPPPIIYTYSSDDDAANNREFARQLASVKQGTKISSKAKDDTRQKSVKQSRAEELPVTTETAAAVSAPSSTAGIDADDDRSSVASPVLGAVAAGGVSDMLEKQAPGPSVLRLTVSEDKPVKAKKAKAAPEPVETKKQRQNRKKVEQAKAAREEAEVERKSKLEAQRRTARLAEGRAAKDGSAFVAAQTSASSAWTGNGVKSSAEASAGSATFIPAQPLDTFDSNAVHTDASKSSARSGDKGEDWMSSLPSEEEQMEMLRKEEEESWSTVKTKSRKSKAADAGENGHADTAAPKVAPVFVAGSGSSAVKSFTQKSAFAALSTDTPAEEEAEWDV